MAKLTPRKFSLEDFKDAPQWMGNFLSTLNQFIQETNTAISNNLTTSENLYREILETTFINNTGVFPINIRTKFNAVPKGINIIYCKSPTDDTLPSVQPLMDWQWGNQTFKISSISGLTASKKYTVRIEVIYG